MEEEKKAERYLKEAVMWLQDAEIPLQEAQEEEKRIRHSNWILSLNEDQSFAPSETMAGEE